jgi:cobalamin biosynthesis protein CobC
MPDHGGRLLQAVERYGLPRERWLDLSTGINPHAWQGPSIPVSSWNRLPEDEDGLVEAAQTYYGAPRVLPVSGSQAAIQTLPKLRDRSRVGVPMLGYNEHGYRWTAAGHEVVPLTAGEFGAAAGEVDVLVVSNPNNPTGERVTAVELLEWHRLLVERRGWLVVDEAFADASPENSVARFTDRDGLIVLRSLGKFFGLAGARVGFVLAGAPLLAELGAALGPWQVSGPSRWVARGALSDRAWQEATRQDLRAAGARLEALLSGFGLAPDGGCELFQWVRAPEALAIHEALARQGILTRHFASVPSLRFGLPGAEGEWDRLESVLRELRLGDGAARGVRMREQQARDPEHPKASS